MSTKVCGMWDTFCIHFVHINSDLLILIIKTMYAMCIQNSYKMYIHCIQNVPHISTDSDTFFVLFLANHCTQFKQFKFVTCLFSKQVRSIKLR